MTFALALLLAAAPGPEIQGPVAVMPFKNLNADPTLEWLRAGVAETMVSDLKKSGKLAVVERAQIDKAMAEIALQASGGTEESTAARVGKMTGAKTVVVGSFQQAQQQLRLNARFVAVETGEVVGAAKTTGPVGEVFLLQDQIIGKLLGSDAKASAPVARKRKTGDSTLKAYKLYAMALTTASDADRVGYLNEAVQTDPDFSYAQDELAALKERLAKLEKKNEKAIAAAVKHGEDSLDDDSLSTLDRATEVVQTMGKMMADRQYARLKRFAKRVMDAHPPGYKGMDPAEIAHFYLFTAQQQLKERDPALHTGEEFMKRYPGSTYFSAVEMQMKVLLDQRMGEADESAKADKELQEVEKDRQEARVKHATRPETLANLERSYDFRRCSILHRFHRNKEAVETCGQFASYWDGRPPPDKGELVLMSRYLTAMAYADMGDFKRAREVAQKLLAEHPEWSQAKTLETLARWWPKD